MLSRRSSGHDTGRHAGQEFPRTAVFCSLLPDCLFWCPDKDPARSQRAENMFEPECRHQEDGSVSPATRPILSAR